MKPEILQAYNKLITEINSLQKDKDNPYFKSKYVDLNQILDEVKAKIIANGFTLLQTIRNGKLHSELVWIETAEVFLECDLDLIGATDMQKAGSAITYGRRYSLLPMLQLQCEDDDGNAAVGNEIKRSSYDDLKTKADFLLAIDKAPDRKHLGALYYKWSVLFPKGTPEYKEIDAISKQRKEELIKVEEADRAEEVNKHLQDETDFLNNL